MSNAKDGFLQLEKSTLCCLAFIRPWIETVVPRVSRPAVLRVSRPLTTSPGPEVRAAASLWEPQLHVPLHKIVTVCGRQRHSVKRLELIDLLDRLL